MATTLRIDDQLYREAKAAAARQGITITRFIEDALRLKLRGASAVHARERVALPTYAAGAGFPYSLRELKALIQGSDGAANRTRARSAVAAEHARERRPQFGTVFRPESRRSARRRPTHRT